MTSQGNHAVDGPATEDRHHPAPQQSLTDTELRAWVEAIIGGQIVDRHPISGGTRCRSRAVDRKTPAGATLPLHLRYRPPHPASSEPCGVWREAKVYRQRGQRSVRAPRLIATHAGHPAILTDHGRGRADFRRTGPVAGPQSGLGGWLYSMFRPNMGTVAGGAWVWDDQAVQPGEVPYCASFSATRIPEDQPLTAITLPTGVRMKMVEPLT